MMNNQVAQMLGQIENCLRAGALTPTKSIDGGTFVLLTQKLPDGSINFFQSDFDKLPSNEQAVLKGKSKGEMVGGYKVIAIFDMWEVETNG